MPESRKGFKTQFICACGTAFRPGEVWPTAPVQYKPPMSEDVERSRPLMENTETAGGSRYSAGKPVACFAPYGGLGLIEEHSNKGADKYAPLDYLNGQSYSTLLSCAWRHVRTALRDPLSVDAETGSLHVTAAAWNLLALLDFHVQGRDGELDDVTPWQGVNAARKRELMDRYDGDRRKVLDALRAKNPV